MASEDPETPFEKAPEHAAAPRVAHGPVGNGRSRPVLELSLAEPDLASPPPVGSVDDLLALLEEETSPASTEDNEPLVLQRGSMLHSAHPPPLPSKVEGQRRSRLPPPLPMSAPSPPRPAGPPPLPSKPPAAPPSPRRASSIPPPLPRALTRSLGVELLMARAALLKDEGDRVLHARALAEIAVVQELSGDDQASVAAAEAALTEDPTLAAMHTFLRRKQHERGRAGALLAHVDAEVAQAPEGPVRTSLLAERSRLLAAEGQSAEVLSAWSYVLSHDPRHAAALRGKEAALAAAGELAAEAEHLRAMAEAYVADPPLAAWLEVERAALLELRLGQVEPARRALQRGLALDPRVGPVRRAMVRHVARHRDAAALVDLLEEEGSIETDPLRAARLELEAATIAEGATGEPARAVRLLERAAARAPTNEAVDVRVLGDLIRLLEGAGRSKEAARWRRARLERIEGGAARAEELRALARVAEAGGDRDAAIADLEASLAEQGDPATVNHLDRLLESAGRHEPRVALWVTDAARSSDVDARVASLLRAAAIAERALGRPDEAIRHLRTAWTTKPGQPEVLDALARLLARPSGEIDPVARARLELYAHAAIVADDTARRIAYLEKVALLAEETLGDFARAAGAYDEILALEPARLSALLGLSRSATRARDARTLFRALLSQARVASSESDALALKARAAMAIRDADAPLALSVATEILEADPSHAGARGLVTRIHEDSGTWELVAESIEAEIPYLSADRALVSLLYLAEVHDVHLKAPSRALATLARAREIAPDDPRVMTATARALEATSDPSSLRDAYMALASAALREEERSAYLVRAAEISEHRLKDDPAALRAYEEALLASPLEPLILDRLERVRTRVGSDVGGAPGDPLDHALELVIREDDLGRARPLLDEALSRGRAPVPALRLLERIHRGAEEWSALAVVLARQAELFRAPLPKLGALWALAALEEWKLEGVADHATYGLILALDAVDPEALLATIRTRLPAALAGDDAARRAVVQALRRRSTLHVGLSRTTTLFVLAHLLEADLGASAEASADEALGAYRDILEVDESSVTAAWGLRRLAHRLGRVADAVIAGAKVAALTVEPKARARHYVETAELVTTSDESAGLGGADARSDRAAELLERALEADPDSLAAATALTALRTARDHSSELLLALRNALARATDKEAIVFLGSEVAHLAREELHDVGIATVAMQQVRAAAPTHAASLLTLAELYLAQRAWPEAVSTLESVVEYAVDVEPRLTALFALGSIYDKVLARPEEHERVLRAALGIDPESPRALRGLIEQLRGRHDPKSREAGGELVALLRRLAKAEPDAQRRSETLLEVSELEAASGDAAAAEESILEAIVASPSNARAFARLSAFFRGQGGLDAAAYARALQELISRGREEGVADARWFAALGQLEVDTLQRMPEGIAHLEWAVQLDATLHETRFELAEAYAKTGAREPAIRALLSLFVPDPRPLTSLADAGLALASLERLLEQDKHPEEAVVVSELRAFLGELEPGRAEWLKGRALAPLGSDDAPIGRTSLVSEVLPRAGRHVLLEVAAASTGLDQKTLRTNVAELGVHARERVGPRSNHPARPAFDRAIRALGLDEVDLVVSPAVDRVRVVIQDTPWIVVPASFESVAPQVQVAVFARLASRVSLGVPWLAELSNAQMLAWLVAVARQVVPSYAADETRTAEVATYEHQVGKTIARRQRKLLEGLVPHLQAREGKPPDMATFRQDIDACTVRASYLVSGDLDAVARAVALVDRDDPRLKDVLGPPSVVALGALLVHPLLGDAARFALSAEATALRRRVASTWAR